MEEEKNPFRTLGIVSIVIGLIDIGIMIYAITHQLSYSSSFNIVAVIAGILLLKRNMLTARVMRWVNLVFLLMFVIGLPLIILGMPFDLAVAYARLNFWGSIGSVLLWFAFGALFFWAQRQFQSQEAKAVFEASGYSSNPPRSAIAMGFIFFLGGSGLVWYMANGEAPMKAKELAGQQLGEGFRYHVTNIHSSGEHVSAIVVAYNNEEIRHVQVGW